MSKLGQRMFVWVLIIGISPIFIICQLVFIKIERQGKMLSAVHNIHRDRAPSTSYMNQEHFDKIFQFQPPPKIDHKQKIGQFFSCLTSFDKFIQFLVAFFPILQWLPEYEWKQNLIGDAMAGLTVAVVHVPQGIAYAILTGVDPVNGLYTSFFGVIFYMIFGTSKYVSVGSFAIISLMTGVSCRNIKDQIDNAFFEAEVRMVDNAQEHHLAIDLNNLTALVPKVNVDHVELVQLVTLVSGLIQISMGLLRVEFLASYLSDQLVNGFCTGAAVHVVVVQINKLIQVDVTKFSGPGYLIKHLMDLFDKVMTTNLTAMIISICGFLFLYLGKDVLGSKIRKYLPAPIPFELLLVIISTGISAIWNFESTKLITVVKEVPIGLPVAKIPRIELISYVIGPAFEIAFVVVALHLSMCKVFNRKLGSKTDNNQELYAMGILASLSSFFNTYPISSSLGRSMLNVECGAKTQLSSLFTAILLLIVILFLGPLLSTLPMCILAVIIIYSMKGVFQKMPHELAQLWTVAKIDFMIWIVTFVATVILNVMSGLAVAVVFALLTTIFRIQWPRWRMLSQLTGTEEYRDIGRYGRTSEIDGIKIFRFDAPLLFTNVEHFSNSIDRALFEYENFPGTTTLQNFILSPTPKQTKQIKNKSIVARIFASKDDYDKGNFRKNNGVEHFIVDCSGFTFIDFTSVSALIDIFKRLQRKGINVYFAEAKAPMRDTLKACGFYNTVSKCNFYPTIHDAVLAACEQKRSRTLSAAIESPRNEKQFFIEDGLGIPTSPIRIESRQNLESLQIGSLDGWESCRRLDVQDDL